MSRLPEPLPPDCCGGCDRDRPLYLLEGAAGDRLHRCLECLRVAVAGELIGSLRRERDQARAWARQMWVTSGPPRRRNRPELGPPPDWLTAPEQLPVTDPPTAAGDDARRGAHAHEEVPAEGTGIDGDWAAGAEERIRVLERELGAMRATLDEVALQRDEARASLRVAEEVVVRQKALLETGTEMIEEARRWARSLWDDGPASEEPVVLNEPEFAPAWVTADGPRHTARPPRSPRGADPAVAAHALRLAALDRLLADHEEEWGPITAEEMATAAERLRNRASTQP